MLSQLINLPASFAQGYFDPKSHEKHIEWQSMYSGAISAERNSLQKLLEQRITSTVTLSTARIVIGSLEVKAHWRLIESQSIRSTATSARLKHSRRKKHYWSTTPQSMCFLVPTAIESLDQSCRCKPIMLPNMYSTATIAMINLSHKRIWMNTSRRNIHGPASIVAGCLQQNRPIKLTMRQSTRFHAIIARKRFIRMSCWKNTFNPYSDADLATGASYQEVLYTPMEPQDTNSVASLAKGTSNATVLFKIISGIVQSTSTPRHCRLLQRKLLYLLQPLHPAH